jgi:monofunctional biosynthetic peptidoglycan transglycosylase
MKLRLPRRAGRARRKRSRLRQAIVAVAAALGVLLAASVLATLLLRWIPPFCSALMVERHVSAILGGRKYSATYEWVRWSRIAPAAPLAVIAAEDQRFAEHNGFDMESIQDALEDQQRGRRLRGASTISQQVAKNMFLWPGRSWVRKGLEAYFTVLIETLWPKRRILEVYLNVAEMGDGIFGIEAASQRYFRKPASRLTPDEAALLAAVLPNPHRLRASRPSAFVQERREWVRRQMDQLGGVGYIKQF